MNSESAYVNTISHNKINSGVESKLWDNADVLTKSACDSTPLSLNLSGIQAFQSVDDASAQYLQHAQVSTQLTLPSLALQATSQSIQSSSQTSQDAAFHGASQPIHKATLEDQDSVMLHSSDIQDSVMLHSSLQSTKALLAADSTSSIASDSSCASCASLYVSGPCQTIALNENNKTDINLYEDCNAKENFLLHRTIKSKDNSQEDCSVYLNGIDPSSSSLIPVNPVNLERTEDTYGDDITECSHVADRSLSPNVRCLFSYKGEQSPRLDATHTNSTAEHRVGRAENSSDSTDRADCADRADRTDRADCADRAGRTETIEYRVDGLTTSTFNTESRAWNIARQDEELECSKNSPFLHFLPASGAGAVSDITKQQIDSRSKVLEAHSTSGIQKSNVCSLAKLHTAQPVVPIVAQAPKQTGQSYLQTDLSKPSFSSPYAQQAFSTLLQEFGHRIQQAFMDDDVTEIMLNTDGRIFIEYNSRGMVEAGYLDACSAQAVIRTLASLQDRELDSSAPILSSDIPNLKARFEGVLPPLTSAPVFSIRKHNTTLYSLDRLCRLKMLSLAQKSLLQDALRQHFSMVVSGPTGSGKTALINSLLGELATVFPEERIITIEDTPELFISSANHLNLYTSSKVDMSCLVRSSLRLRPDRLIIGEVRGPEALDLIDAFLTGHSGGFTSVHGGSVKQALNRLMLLISRHRSAPRHIGPVVADAIDMVIQVQKEPYRHVSEIALVKGFVRESFAFRVLDPEQSNLSQDDFER